MRFDTMGLDPAILTAIETAGYTTPTPIQEQAIPVVLAGRDVLGIAQTGTGKTASFTLPMIHRLMRGRAKARMPRTLILEPTRELAAQVAESFSIYGKNTKLTKALLIGGVGFDAQEQAITRGADVLIATPGRLLDHVERGKVLLRGVEILVIDEADRMLDMGFIPDIEKIVKLLPFTRQTLFFSATMPPAIMQLADQFLSAPARIEVAPPASPTETVIHKLVSVRAANKTEGLQQLLRRDEVKNGIIFCNRKRDIASLHRALVKYGFSVASLHGDMDQYKRMQMLDQFRNGDVTFLIASDVAARGLDIPNVSHVFNFDVPTQAEDYIHRIGRTGRAGKSGHAFTLTTSADIKYVQAIEKLLRQPIAHEDGFAVIEGQEETEADSTKPRQKKSRRTTPSRGRTPGRRGLAARRKPTPHRDTEKDNTEKDKTEKRATRATQATRAKQAKQAKPNKPKAKGFGENMPAFMQGTMNKSDKS